MRQSRLDRADDPAGVRTRAYRQDAALLRPPVRQADGSLRIDVQIAEPGIYVYGTRRELVPRSTLSDPVALETLKLRPVTLEHPDPVKYPQMVTPDSVQDLSVGSTGENVRLDDGRPCFPIVVTRRDALDWIESKRVAGEPVEVSPGHFDEIDHTPGVDPEFGPYDAIQVRREYNHLALTEAGRGGPAARARVDSQTGRRLEPRHDGAPKTMLEALIASGYSRADAARIVAHFDSMGAKGILSRLDGSDPAEMQKELDAAKARVDELTEEMKKQQEEPPKMDSIPKASLLAAVDEVVALRELAGRFDAIKPEAAVKLDAAELRTAIATAAGIEVPASMRADVAMSKVYVQARIDALPAQLPAGRDARLDGLRPPGKPEKRIDSDDDDSIRFDSLGSYGPKAAAAE